MNSGLSFVRLRVHGGRVRRAGNALLGVCTIFGTIQPTRPIAIFGAESRRLQDSGHCERGCGPMRSIRKNSKR